MKAHEAFPSKYLKTEDLEGRSVTVTIERVISETIKKDDGSTEEKRVIYFKNATRGMVLNQTNWNSIADLTGKDDDDEWSGAQIVLYPTKTQFGAKIVPCIRVQGVGVVKQSRVPVPQLKPVQSENVDINDEIPF